jgi:osmotically-inducible protein OsmY
MLQRFKTQRTGSRPGAIALAVNRLYQEFLMNRTFSLITLQSAAAAAVLAAAPLVSAEQWTEPQVAAPSGSTLIPAEVRQVAIEARDARQRMAYSGETAADPTAAPFAFTGSRAQMHAQAVEATRLGGTQTVTVTGDRLASNVKAAIFQAVGEKSPDITVANRDGFISLGGWARTGSDVSQAMHVALAVDGVKQVYNDGVRLWSSRSSDY